MQLPPAEVTASWPPPNYDNPESRGPELLIVGVITLAVALICLILRLYVKIGILHRCGWDDWFMVSATVAGIGMTLTVLLANTLYGWNHHIWDLHFSELVTARKVSIAAQVLYLFATWLAKVSILLSYMALAPPQTSFRRLSQLTIVLLSLGQISFLVVLFTQCIPASSYWDLLRMDADCHVRESHSLMAQAVMTVLADMAVWTLPLPTFYAARLPLAQKVALIVLFSFGAVVVVAACLRTYWLWWAVGVTWDVTWECRNEWIWTAVEVHLGIICGCVPWLRSLVKLWGTRRERSMASAVKIGSGRDTVTVGSRRTRKVQATYEMDEDDGMEMSVRDSDGTDLEAMKEKRRGI